MVWEAKLAQSLASLRLNVTLPLRVGFSAAMLTAKSLAVAKTVPFHGEHGRADQPQHGDDGDDQLHGAGRPPPRRKDRRADGVGGRLGLRCLRQ